jgi:hypothetical protein
LKLATLLQRQLAGRAVSTDYRREKADTGSWPTGWTATWMDSARHCLPVVIITLETASSCFVPRTTTSTRYPTKANAIQPYHLLVVNLAFSSSLALGTDPPFQSRVLGLMPPVHQTMAVLLLKPFERFELGLPLGVDRTPDKANGIQLLYELAVHLALSASCALGKDTTLQSRVLGLVQLGHQTMAVLIVKPMQLLVVLAIVSSSMCRCSSM